MFVIPTPVPIRRVAVALAALAAAVAAHPAAAITPVDAAALRPGDYRLAGGAAQGPLRIAVSIADQKLYAWRGPELVAVSTVSTGKRGHRTPVGVFAILEKRRAHFSNLYNNAPMPFMQRLTWDGIALHAGKLPGYPASHGCVRLPIAFAERLFAMTAKGGTVEIVQRSLADTVTRAPLPALAIEVPDIWAAPARLPSFRAVPLPPEPREREPGPDPDLLEPRREALQPEAGTNT